MRFRYNVLVRFALALALAAAVSPAKAATIYATTFDSLSTGNINGQDSWVGTLSNTASVATGGTGAFSSPNFLAITGGNAFRNASGAGSTSVDTQAELEFVSGNGTMTVWGLGNQTIGTATINPLSNVVTFNGNPALTLAIPTSPLGSGQYYLADINANFNNFTYSFTISGGSIPVGTTLANIPFQNDISFNGVNFAAGGSLSVDNLNIQGNAAGGTPEPSTVLTLGGGLAALGLARWRRARR